MKLTKGKITKLLNKKNQSKKKHKKGGAKKSKKTNTMKNKKRPHLANTTLKSYGGVTGNKETDSTNKNTDTMIKKENFKESPLFQKQKSINNPVSGEDLSQDLKNITHIDSEKPNENPTEESMSREEGNENPTEESMSREEGNENPTEESMTREEGNENPTEESMTREEGNENPTVETMSREEGNENPTEETMSREEGNENPTVETMSREKNIQINQITKETKELQQEQLKVLQTIQNNMMNLENQIKEYEDENNKYKLANPPSLTEATNTILKYVSGEIAKNLNNNTDRGYPQDQDITVSTAAEIQANDMK